MSPRALLMVALEPPASLEEEFNDWYDYEHFPQRRAMPGFDSASRWVCLDGWPRWLALYDLSSLAALETDAYRAVTGMNSSPWSRRMLPRVTGRTRVVATALGAQEPVQLAPERTARLVQLGFALDGAASDAATEAHANAIVAGVRAAWRDHAGLRQLRSFVADSAPGQSTLWLLGAFDEAVRAEALQATLGRPAGQAPRTFNLFAPYLRAGYTVVPNG